MSRYNILPTIKNPEGKNIIPTVILNIPTHPDDVYIRITSRELLTALSYEFYNTEQNWHIIAAANGLGKGSLWVNSDTILRIPKHPSISKYLLSINTTR